MARLGLNNYQLINLNLSDVSGTAGPQGIQGDRGIAACEIRYTIA